MKINLLLAENDETLLQVRRDDCRHGMEQGGLSLLGRVWQGRVSPTVQVFPDDTGEVVSFQGLHDQGPDAHFPDLFLGNQ